MATTGKNRVLMAGLLTLAVAGCGGPTAEKLESAVRGDRPLADAALLEVVKGNDETALLRAENALRDNPTDPYALLAAAVVHHNAGRYEQARRHYHRLLQLDGSVRDTLTLNVRAWTDLEPATIGEIAKANLSRLDSDREFGQWRAETAPAAAARPVLSDDNVIRRFQVLKLLLDDGLVDDAEFQTRRAVNLSGLLPMTAPPSATRMAAPFPATENIIGRLRMLQEAFRGGSISSQSYLAERAVVLDALLPANARILATPPIPPQGVMEAAAMLRRINRLKEMGLVSADEAARERAAIEDAVRDTQSRATGR